MSEHREPEATEETIGGADGEFSPTDADSAADPSDAGATDGSVEDPGLVTEAGVAPEPGDGTDASPEADASPEDVAAKYLALAQRTQADFENFRKRAARDAAAAQQRGVAKLVKDLLPALDNLERAIAHAPAEDPLLEGIKLVRADLAGALTRAGIEAFDPAGENFDPTVHEAVAQFPKEGVAPGTVTEVYQQGYRLNDTVLRPARVVVAS